MKDYGMEMLSIQINQFPQDETLKYALRMIGAKGGVSVQTKKDESGGVQIKAHVLASLILPPKKLVDSEVTSKLETDASGMLRLQKYVDYDYKTEAKRVLEVKAHGIESRYQKFEEERGFIEVPENLSVEHIVDPLSAFFLARGLKTEEGKKAQLSLLTRNGIANMILLFGENKKSDVPALNGQRDQIRLRIETEQAKTMKGPYFSPDFEIWLDKETGILTEVSYTFLGVFGRGELKLESVN